MHFTRAHEDKAPQIEINGQTIDNPTHIKYLGITLNQKVNYKMYIEQLNAKIKKINNILKMVGHPKTGINTKCLVIKFIIYNSTTN